MIYLLSKSHRVAAFDRRLMFLVRFVSVQYSYDNARCMVETVFCTLYLCTNECKIPPKADNTVTLCRLMQRDFA